MTRHTRPLSAAHLLFLSAALAALAVFATACGGKVVVDADGTGGDGGSGSGSSSASGAGGTGGDTLSCGEEPNEGKIVAICVSMDGGDFCLPAANSPGLLTTLSDAMGVCAETSSTACCNKPALRQVVCDLPPSGDECCYHAHYLENVVCAP
jgi:hypothetical protein